MALDDSYTKVLLHMDGSDDGTAFTDESGKSWSRYSTPVTSVDQKKFGTASYYSSTRTKAIYTADHADFSFGTSDLTIDCWARFEAWNDYLTYLYSHYDDPNNGFRFDFRNQTYQSSSKMLVAQSLTGGASAWYCSSGYETGWNLDTWYHFAFVRSGSHAYLFVNGTRKCDTAISYTFPNRTGSVYVGNGPGTTLDSGVYGYIDEFRYSLGIARWTEDFTPPTRAYGVKLKSGVSVSYISDYGLL